MKLGIIGGSGLYDIDGFEFMGEESVVTEWGAPSDAYRHFSCKGVDFYFLNRHGRSHGIPPHSVNYRANIAGFEKLGVERIISFTAVGGIRGVKPGDIVISSNAIDHTSGRAHTFYDGGLIHHIDFTEPFCPELRALLLESAERAGVEVKDSGVYICTNGPRLETSAEIRYFASIGADTVGMTLFPEAPLAREKEICYANVSVITNHAAGTGDTKLTTVEVVETMKAATERIKAIVSALPDSYTVNRKCLCKDALEGTKISK
ncbi:S-methyl-5'-thioinosine phosphorylase [Geovibrio thiophilus]|uniref:Probable 6-oxopurine nucleoside phosphorylase n=1 Tax=Geovibrio thiophilus TaxID=139438 RepID=A0A3R5V2X1_9BACT|nr:S-methyl-5'-thioinosine phosphorylase [Geovibrio thiophilus]QAR34257.1 S-methyl-5'-thioinosine phosphorylase [Geovibrio thiophilus]